MEERFLKPFVDATVQVLEMMAQLPVEAGETHLKESNKTWGEITGIVGMAGHDHSGNMMLSFDKATILRIIESMIGESAEDINNDVIDAVGELTNMISSGARARFSEMGIELDMALPLTIVGTGVEVSQFGADPSVAIPFKTSDSEGGFVIETNLCERLK